MPKHFMEDLSSTQIERMANVVRDHREWSDTTFGSVGPIGPLEHLVEEAAEAKDDPSNPEEYADCMFLIWDALSRQNAFTVDDLLDAMEMKMAKNRARQWPEPKDGAKRNHITANE